MQNNGANEQEAGRTSADLIRELRAAALDDREMFAALQKELRRRAAAKMKRERQDHTLQATALVNEAFLKLFKDDNRPNSWSDEAHATNAISQAMERILLDHAEAHMAAKRGDGGRQRVAIDQQQAAEMGDGEQRRPLDQQLLVKPEQSEELLAVREVLSQLQEISTRQARVVRLQFYAGLHQEEIAALLGVSVETVKLDWRKAKTFLKDKLQARKNLAAGSE